MKKIHLYLFIFATILAIGFGFWYWQFSKKNTLPSGTLKVVTEPAGAMIMVNGEHQGFSPLVLSNQNIGLQFVQIQKEGYPAYSRLVRVTTTDTMLLSIDLRKLLEKEERGDYKTDVEMIYIPAGRFKMGLNSNQIDRLLTSDNQLKREWFMNQTPQREINLDAFYIDKYEVTNVEFARFLNETQPDSVEEFIGYHPEYQKIYPSGSQYLVRPGYEDYPVVMVSWKGANAFAEWANKRLPTEAEWEKAARGTTNWLFPWGDHFQPNLANTNDVNDTFLYLASAKTFSKGGSPYDVQNMAGNVWEWCLDDYVDDYYQQIDLSNPRINTGNSKKTVRGGSYLNSSHLTVVTSRQPAIKTLRHVATGFRCVKDAK